MPLSRDSKSSAPPSPKYPIEKLHAQAQYNNVADKQRKFRKQYDNQMKLYERMIREALERGDYAAVESKKEKRDKYVQKNALLVTALDQQLALARRNLQQRYGEEAALIRMARSKDDRPYGLPEEICEHIASINTHPRSWDKPFPRPAYRNSIKPEKSEQSPEEPKLHSASPNLDPAVAAKLRHKYRVRDDSWKGCNFAFNG